VLVAIPRVGRRPLRHPRPKTPLFSSTFYAYIP
jgi:hypothetical protein